MRISGFVASVIWLLISGCVAPTGVRIEGGPLKITPAALPGTEISQAVLLGGEGNDYGEFILCGSDGSCDLIGLSKRSFGPGVGFLVSKLDSDGKISWTRVYDPTGNNFLTTAIMTHDGGIVLTANSYSQFGDMAAYPAGRGLMLKLSADGDPVWAGLIAAPYKGDTVIRVSSVAETADGSLIATGACLNSDKSDNLIEDLAVMKYSGDGHLIWSKCYRFDHNTFGGRAQVGKDGRIRVEADYDGVGSDRPLDLLVTLSADGICQQADGLVADEGVFHSQGLAERSDGVLVIPGELAIDESHVNNRAAVVWLDHDGSVRAARSYGIDGGFSGGFSSWGNTSVFSDGIAVVGHTGALNPHSFDAISDAVAFIIDGDGNVEAGTKLVARRPDPKGFSFSEFQNITQIAPRRYRLLGDTAAFNADGNFDVVTGLWAPTGKLLFSITPSPLKITVEPVALPAVYVGNNGFDELPVGRLNIVDVRNDAKAQR